MVGAKTPNAARQARSLLRKGPVRVALAEEKEKKRVGVGEGGPKTLHISRGGCGGGSTIAKEFRLNWGASSPGGRILLAGNPATLNQDGWVVA